MQSLAAVAGVMRYGKLVKGALGKRTLACILKS